MIIEGNEIRVGLGIVAFDDVLHLKNIVCEIRDMLHVVIVCLQKESWHGDPIDGGVVEYIEKMKADGYVDDVVWFESKNNYDDNNPSKPRMIETDKRNFIIDRLQSMGCTHSHVIDSDEFYDHDDYMNAVGMVARDRIPVSYCEYINYYRDYRHLMVWPFRCYVPFVSDIRYRFSYDCKCFDKPSDPTRRFLLQEGENYCIFKFQIIKMHHLSWIRKNIDDKINNWSAKRYFNENKGLIERIKERYNNYKDGQNAVIMFNVPFYSVVVNRLPCSYIHPKFNILEDLK